MDVKYAVLDPLMRILPAQGLSPECPELLGRAGMPPVLIELIGQDHHQCEETCGMALAPAKAHAIVLKGQYEIVRDE